MIKIKSLTRRLVLLRISLLLFVILLFIWLLKTIWLVLTVLVLFTLLFCCWRLKRTVTRYFSLFLLTILVFILSKAFIFEIYRIPSGSMESTFFPGDEVIVNKLTYGPKLPQSPLDIPWINIAFFELMGKKAQNYHWPYRRLEGRNPIQRNDIFVFRAVDGDTATFIKRCQGLPGDTIEIADRQVFVNHKAVIAPDLILEPYIADITNYDTAKIIFDRLKIPYQLKTDSGLQVYIALDKQQKMALSGCRAIKRVYYHKMPMARIPSTYPWDWRFNWTIENYGPVVVPSKGMIVELTLRNYLLYKKIFEKFENAKITLHGNKYFQNGKPTDSYRIKNNYYFVLGDNRSDSNDSRYWGFLPEQNIEGKVVQ